MIVIVALHTVFRVSFHGVTLNADPSMTESIDNLDPPLYDGIFDFRLRHGQAVTDGLGSPASAFVETLVSFFFSLHYAIPPSPQHIVVVRLWILICL